MTEWPDLRLFLALHRGGSITAAARKLGTTVSTVSRHLDILEGELGEVLFLRGPEGVTPTDAAARLLQLAGEVELRMVRVAETVRPVVGEPEGIVRVATSPDIGHTILLPSLPTLLRRYPLLRVDLALSAQFSDLSRREADLAIRLGVPGGGEDLVVRPLRVTPWCVFGARSYLRHYPATLPLDQHRWVDQTAEWSETPAVAWLRARVPSGVRVLRSSDLTGVRLGIAAGIGLGVLPDTLGVTTPGLVALDVPVEIPGTPMFLVAHRDTRRLAAVRAVWDFVEELLGRREDRAESDEIAILRGRLRDSFGWVFPEEPGTPDGGA